MVQAVLLQQHIESMNAGVLDWSQVEMNSRADLVRFEGYSVADAAALDENEVYRILDGHVEDDEWSDNYLGIVHHECGSKDIKIQWINGYPGRYGSSEDGYLCKCSCGEEYFIHECALDAWEGEE